MARPNKQATWGRADPLRIRVWFHAVLHSFFPDNRKPRAADLDRLFQMTSTPLASSRLSAWQNGKDRPSADWLARIRRKNKVAGRQEFRLVAGTAITEHRLDNLFLALEASCLQQQRREWCLIYLDQIIRVWLAQPDRAVFESGVRDFGWRLPALERCKLDAATLQSLNPMDPLSGLNYFVAIGTDALLPLVNIRLAENPQLVEEWLMAWGFDLLCLAVLIATLVRHEMTAAEHYLVGNSAEAGIWLLAWYLHDGYSDPDPGKLGRMLRTMGFQHAERLVELLLRSRETVFHHLAQFGLDVSLVRAMFPDLLPNHSAQVKLPSPTAVRSSTHPSTATREVPGRPGSGRPDLKWGAIGEVATTTPILDEAPSLNHTPCRPSRPCR